MSMNEQELRELDAWLAEHVMEVNKFVGLKKRGLWYRPNAHGYTYNQSEAWKLTREEAKLHEYPRGDEPVTICEFETEHYSTEAAPAMQVLEKCAEKCTVLVTKTKAGECCISGAGIGLSADTLPIAIALFAKQLFSK